MMRSRIEFDLPERVAQRQPARTIDAGVYFVGRLFVVDPNAKNCPLSGFDAVENKGVFYKTNTGITFLENDTETSPRGGRWWGLERSSSEPLGGPYVENFEKVNVVVTVKRAA